MKAIIDLELERRALHEALYQLSRCDGRMASSIDRLCCDIEARINIVTEQIDAHYDRLIEEDQKKIDAISKQLDLAVREARKALAKYAT